MPLAAGGPASRIEKKRQEEFFSVTPRKERVLHAPFALQTGMVSCADAHSRRTTPFNLMLRTCATQLLTGSGVTHLNE